MLALAGTLLLFEGCVRAMLFWGWFTACEPIAALRRPSAFAGRSEDELYDLGTLLAPEGTSYDPPGPDPLLGWRPPRVDAAYLHEGRLALGSERPLLLFGDSFAGCVVPTEAFQVLFEGTRYGASMELLNYGCGGYGLDQIRLLAARALPHWTRHDPLVLISLLVDDGMDRCRLSLHPWPKPRYRLEGGEPALERAAVPTMDEHMAQAFPPTKSWAWRLLLHSGALPLELGLELSGATAADLEVQVLCERLLEMIVADLRERRMTFGFLLFYSLPSVKDPSVLGWREALVLEVLDRERVPYVLTRGRLARHMAASGRPDADYYYPSGKLQDHLTTLGNQVVLEDILALVDELTAGAPPYVPPAAALPLGSFRHSVLPGKISSARYIEKRERLVLRAGPGEPTEVRYAIDATTRLCFDAWSPARGAGGQRRPEGGAELGVLVDGREVAAVRIARGAPAQSLELDVAGADEVAIRVVHEGPGRRQVVYLEGCATR